MSDRCRDPNCQPERGDEGCMAHVCNVGAFDGLDGVWVKAWDECPLMRAAEKQHDADLFEQSQFEAWCETWESFADALADPSPSGSTNVEPS